MVLLGRGQTSPMYNWHRLSSVPKAGTAAFLACVDWPPHMADAKSPPHLLCHSSLTAPVAAMHLLQPRRRPSGDAWDQHRPAVSVCAVSVSVGCGGEETRKAGTSPTPPHPSDGFLGSGGHCHRWIKLKVDGLAFICNERDGVVAFPADPAKCSKQGGGGTATTDHHEPLVFASLRLAATKVCCM